MNNFYNPINWTDSEIRDQIARSTSSKNCPNCGAPIESERCPYCGSLFVDFACIDTDQPFYMKVKHKGQIGIVKVMFRGLSIHRDDPICMYANNEPIITMQSTSGEMTMEFRIL